MKIKILKILIGVLISIICIGICAFLLINNGIILLNNPSIEEYPVRGIDVSSYQGEINWETLSNQGISFAFIKATEGSSYVDEYFNYNYSQASSQNLRVGAYHFFSYDSKGNTQAENFINNVKIIDHMLPPVVDVEFYGDYYNNPPKAEDVQSELNDMLTKLEEHYNMTPIIYATQKSYKMFLSGKYDNYDIWIRDVIFTPDLSDDKEWTFWQYTDREILLGYKGKEKFIDMNVFNGTNEDFEKYECLACNSYR